MRPSDVMSGIAVSVRRRRKKVNIEYKKVPVYDNTKLLCTYHRQVGEESSQIRNRPVADQL